METILRNFLMLQIIPRNGTITSKEIQQKLAEEQTEFEVDIRTVQRDLMELSRIFPLQGEGRPIRWTWREDATLFQLPSMTTETALTFKLAELFLKNVLPPSALEFLRDHINTADQTLSKSKNNLQHWPQRIRVLPRGQALKTPKIHTDILRTVYEAVLQQRCLQVKYLRRKDQTVKDFQIHPHGLVLRDEFIYLVGTLWHYKNVKQFALHRFQEAEILEDEQYKPLQDFTLDDYINKREFDHPDSNATFALQIKADSQIAFHLQEAPLSDDQEISDFDANWKRIKATVRDTRQLRWWLQGFGAQVEVLEPESLRQEFIMLSRDLSALYKQA